MSYGCPPMRRLSRWAWIVFVLFALLAILFGVVPGTWFEDDIDRDAQWLVTTFAAVAAVLTLVVATTAFRRGERWAWLGFWIWPVFFVIHGIVVFVVDFVFAVLGVVALLLARPRTARPPDQPPG
jgi:hypothetical protein